MSERVTGPGRGKRPPLRILESSSDSDSDCIVEVVHKRKKSNVIVSESSDSSDSCIAPSRISKPRKKMRRVWTDDESSSEEGEEEESEDSEDCVDTEAGEEEEDVVRPRGRFRQRLESEDSSSGSESEEESSESGHSSIDSFESCDNTDEEAMVQAAIQESLATVSPPLEPQKQTEESVTQSPEAKQPDPGFVSDSSDGQSDKCPICLVGFSTQEIGSPETCDHNFCCVCIQEWAKNVNTCPVDRQPFTLILVRKQLNGKVIRKIPVETREARDPQESDSDPTFCEVCGRSDREDRLLLCDGCDLGYHLECLDPPMGNVPVEEWFCPDCATDQSSNLAEEIDIQAGEIFDLLNDSVHIRPRRSRLLPRTRQSERVRATIRSLHQEMILQDNDEPALQVLYDNGNIQVGYSFLSDSD